MNGGKMNVLKGLKPEKVFYYFEEISKIPRGSGNESGISNYLKRLAENKGWTVIQDDVLNIIIKKKASKGNEDKAAVILQGHMDMVCEKNHDTLHDFLKDPLKLRIIGDDIYATDTTLGADNGIAVAMCLALLDGDHIHPAIEVVITVDEETGMTGAMNMQKENLSGKTLINLDSECEGVFTAGCAGGGRISLAIDKAYKDVTLKHAYTLSIQGLVGGHSGVDIDREKANANKLLGRVLYALKNDLEIFRVSGGSKDNAIPREAYAGIVVNDVENLKHLIDNLERNFIDEYSVTDSKITIKLEKTALPENVYKEAVKNKIIQVILLTPNGVIKKSTEIDLVIASSNLGVIKETNTQIQFINAPRSSVESLMVEYVNNMTCLSDALNVHIDVDDFYPGWTYLAHSPIRDLCKTIYQDLFKKEAKVEAIHAGLECGFFLNLIPGLDAISIGPEMHDVHTPREHMNIPSIERTYTFLLEILKNI